MKYSKIRPRIIAAQTLANAPYYARHGSLEVRLARNKAEIKASQNLRYKIFYEEMSARPNRMMKLARRDRDPYDGVCDHLLVIDHSKGRHGAVVGSYRLLRQDVAERHRGFYSADEYDISPLFSEEFKRRMGKSGQLLELGRSCVHKEYRTTATITLLWRGIASYLMEHNIAYMFGCASLPGIDPAEHAIPLSYLYHEHLAPEDAMVRALPRRFVNMNILPPDAYTMREARRMLPPLIKGYLRLGCFIGDGAVVDYQFSTTDVFILLPVERIAKRYSVHYDLETGANDAELEAAAARA